MKIQHVDRCGQRLTAPTHIGDPIDVLPGTDGSLWVLKTHDQLQHLQSWEITERHSEIADEANSSDIGHAKVQENAQNVFVAWSRSDDFGLIVGWSAPPD